MSEIIKIKMNSKPIKSFVIFLLVALISACASTAEQVSSIEKITAKAEKVSTANVLIISAVGDVMLGGSAGPELEKFGYDYPFEKTKKLFSKSDIVFANLEGPLTHRGQPVVEKKYKFRAPPEKVAPALKKAGVNIVSLANNHSLDYGEQGLADTITALDSNKIFHVGAGKNIFSAREPAIVIVNNTRVAFLGYSLTFPEEFWAKKKSAGTAFGHEGYVKKDVAQASQIADLVIVSFHWGREVTTELRPYQISLGHAAIDAGASVVLGHHPHILQAVEQYKQGVILYSLGNYVFGSYSQKATRSAIAQLEYTDKRLTALQLIPINVNNIEVIFQPDILELAEANKVVQTLKTLSSQRSTNIQNNNGVAVVTIKKINASN